MHYPEKTNPVLTIARTDYNPVLVEINRDAIALLPPSGDLKAMGPTLPQDSICLGLEGIPYFIAMNSLNFQFWDVTEKDEFVRYRHEGEEGALAMRTVFQTCWELAAMRAHEAGRADSDVPFFTRELIDLFGREGLSGRFGEIPAIGKRARILMEVLGDGKLLLNVANTLHEALVTRQQLTWVHAKLLAHSFPVAYGDDYLKKAQLTLMFIAGQWNAYNPGRPCKLDVTAAADYQLPKILRAMGILRYSDWLAASVDQTQLIEAESIAERAIRAGTVLACEELAEHLNCSLPEVDFWLWVNRNQARDAKFHLTRTTAY
ncbi:queuosine salvage family protein [Paraburkholderia sp. EG287A]|uniref:queuosine salvage family protein n=1 Tax=Paraburkholderia sp. EG287A TaxID=3237012 RepID=UPI0034D1AC3B